jgi:hypothetical protein
VPWSISMIFNITDHFKSQDSILVHEESFSGFISILSWSLRGFMTHSGHQVFNQNIPEWSISLQSSPRYYLGVNSLMSSSNNLALWCWYVVKPDINLM